MEDFVLTREKQQKGDKGNVARQFENKRDSARTRRRRKEGSRK